MKAIKTKSWGVLFAILFVNGEQYSKLDCAFAKDFNIEHLFDSYMFEKNIESNVQESSKGVVSGNLALETEGSIQNSIPLFEQKTEKSVQKVEESSKVDLETNPTVENSPPRANLFELLFNNEDSARILIQEEAKLQHAILIKQKKANKLAQQKLEIENFVCEESRLRLKIEEVQKAIVQKKLVTQNLLLKQKARAKQEEATAKAKQEQLINNESKARLAILNEEKQRAQEQNEEERLAKDKEIKKIIEKIIKQEQEVRAKQEQAVRDKQEQAVRDKQEQAKFINKESKIREYVLFEESEARLAIVNEEKGKEQEQKAKESISKAKEESKKLIAEQNAIKKERIKQEEERIKHEQEARAKYEQEQLINNESKARLENETLELKCFKEKIESIESSIDAQEQKEKHEEINKIIAQEEEKAKKEQEAEKFKKEQEAEKLKQVAKAKKEAEIVAKERFGNLSDLSTETYSIIKKKFTLPNVSKYKEILQFFDEISAYKSNCIIIQDGNFKDSKKLHLKLIADLLIKNNFVEKRGSGFFPSQNEKQLEMLGYVASYLKVNIQNFVVQNLFDNFKKAKDSFVSKTDVKQWTNFLPYLQKGFKEDNLIKSEKNKENANQEKDMLLASNKNILQDSNTNKNAKKIEANSTSNASDKTNFFSLNDENCINVKDYELCPTFFVEILEKSGLIDSFKESDSKKHLCKDADLFNMFFKKIKTEF